MSTPVRYTAPTMQRGRWHTGKRWLAALLTVLAAFAFSVRGLLMALGPNPHLAPAVSEMYMEHAGASASTDRSTTQDPHQQSHQAHCLFCLTGAFALEVDTAAPPPAPAVYLTAPLPAAPHSRAAALLHTDARAPPHRV